MVISGRVSVELKIETKAQECFPFAESSCPCGSSIVEQCTGSRATESASWRPALDGGAPLEPLASPKLPEHCRKPVGKDAVATLSADSFLFHD